MALPTATSRLKSFAQREWLLKYQRPFVLKEFVVECMRDLSDDDKAAFRIFCLGYVPVSNMEVNLENDDEILRWFELYFDLFMTSLAFFFFRFPFFFFFDVRVFPPSFFSPDFVYNFCLFFLSFLIFLYVRLAGVALFCLV